VVSPKHVIYLQYAGDFRESLERFARGEPETYFGQRYSVEEVVRLSKISQQTTVVCCLSDKSYDCRGLEGIRTIGLGLSKFGRSECRRVVNLCADLQPTHAVLRFPNWRILSWLVRHYVVVLPVLADSVNRGGIRSWLSRLLLARTLNSARIRVVANHQLNSCRNLTEIGVDLHKIVPYDWPAAPVGEYVPKKHPDRDCWQLLYCGTIIEEKGVGDILRAVSILRSRKVKVTLQILGDGEIARFQRMGGELGVADVCRFRGRVSHEMVLAQMRESDIVLVSSHHSYSEGLPCTIREAMMVYTPLIIADHPMFAGVIVDHVNGLVVPEKSPQSIADAVIAYMMETGLYEQASGSSDATLASIQMPLVWGDLIEKWLDGSPSAISSLLAHSLANWKERPVQASSRLPEVGVGVT
jgi:glycosyltransferase involved in cell wall biosynthesis